MPDKYIHGRAPNDIKGLSHATADLEPLQIKITFFNPYIKKMYIFGIKFR